MAAFKDLGDLEENQRIDIIGKTAMEGKIIGFVVEADGEKADRYISKLLAKFPGLKVYERFGGPVPDTETVKVGPAEG